MKKRTFILVAIFIALFSFNASAYNGNAELILSTWNNAVFFMVIDGQTYDSHSSTYRLSVNSGSHHLEVYTYRGYGNLSRCLFNSNIHLRKGVTSAMITDRGGFYETSFTAAHNNYGNGYGGNNHYGNSYGGGNYNNYGHNGYYNNGYGGTNYGYNNANTYSYGMSPNEYANLKRMIRNTSFDSSRLKIAQSAVVGGISSKQVLGICRLFSFESSRLDFAKFAYNYTIDKNRYYIVNDAFTFNSSIDELSAYVYGF